MSKEQLDRRGAKRSPATFAEFHKGKTPASKGRRYAAHPFSIEDHGLRGQIERWLEM